MTCTTCNKSDIDCYCYLDSFAPIRPGRRAVKTQTITKAQFDAIAARTECARVVPGALPNVTNIEVPVGIYDGKPTWRIVASAVVSVHTTYYFRITTTTKETVR
jgi:hypothetical protein